MATLQNNKDGFSMRNFCLVCDYVCLYLILNNGSRPGAVANMHKHKTDITYTLHKECCYFLKLVLNKLQGVGLGPDKPMFTSWNANPMSPSMVTTQMSNIFNEGSHKFWCIDFCLSALIG